jgi:hypothetical protein
MRRFPKWRIEVIREFPKPCIKRVGYGLNTVNYGRFLAGILDSVASMGNREVTLRDINNDDYNLIVKTGNTTLNLVGAYPIWYLTAGSNAPVSLRVIARLGTGSTSPSRTNVNLQTPRAGDIQLSATYNDGDLVTLTGTGNYGSNFSPSEVGVFMEGSGGSDLTKRLYMLDRTVFTPLPSGRTFTVRVEIPLG